MNTELSMPNDAFGMMGEHLKEVTIELFAAYDLTVRPSAVASYSGSGANERADAAVIGYVGNKIRGALILCAPSAAINTWMELVGASAGDEADTIGEFSNMLLGRLKGRLLGEGLPILLATPTTASGSGLRLSMAPGYSISLLFDGPGWGVLARLDATFDLGFALEAPSQGEIAAAGEAMLF